MRARRGVTLVETLTAAGLLVLSVLGLGALTSAGGRLWARADAGASAKQVLALAMGRMEPTLRSALRVDTSQTTGSRLTVVLPRIDSTTNKYVVPLEAGAVVSFYLSDATGSTSATGTILWRSVNGTPDRSWSLRGARPVVDLGAAGLTFQHDAAATPQLVQLTATTHRWAGARTLVKSASTGVWLRNWRAP